jgi:hypothetical protein
MNQQLSDVRDDTGPFPAILIFILACCKFFLRSGKNKVHYLDNVEHLAPASAPMEEETP